MIEPAAGPLPALVCLDPEGDIWDRLRSLFSDPSLSCEFIVTRAPNNGPALLTLCRRLIPALIITSEDRLRDIPVAGIRGLLEPNGIQILLLSGKTDPVSLEVFFRQGCSGVLDRNASGDTLLQAVRALFSGELWFPRKVVCRLAREAFLREPAPKLTRRESDILQLISLGHTNQEIADHCFITRETVRWHIRSLYNKLGVDDREGAIREAKLFQELTSTVA